jgi:hypothetical protein
MTVKEAIMEFVEGRDEYELYEGYSGRGMFGARCLGVIVRGNCSYMEFLLHLTRYMCDNDVDDDTLELEGVSVDSLGLDTIVYFPRIATD